MEDGYLLETRRYGEPKDGSSIINVGDDGEIGSASWAMNWHFVFFVGLLFVAVGMIFQARRVSAVGLVNDPRDAA